MAKIMDKVDIDWENLTFSYIKTKSHIRYSYRNGEWDDGELNEDDSINLSIAATCLHYGQSGFEGLKAFRAKDGSIKVFRPDENAKRINQTLEYILGPHLPEEIFLEAIQKVVRDNADYIPPYGTGGSLYIRPLIIGSGAQIGIAPTTDYEFIVLVTPVGAYYKHGLKPVNALIVDDYDRAAPKGSGHVKLAGNYAQSLTAAKSHKDKGYPIGLYLDAATRKYIEEFGTSNFIGITKDSVYVTPESPSVLHSITNMSLLQLAEDAGLKTERRQIEIEELANLAEVGACGTAVVVTPIESITTSETVYNYGSECGPILKKLYDSVQGIQYGEKEDLHNWMVEVK